MPKKKNPIYLIDECLIHQSPDVRADMGGALMALYLFAKETVSEEKDPEKLESLRMILKEIDKSITTHTRPR